MQLQLICPKPHHHHHHPQEGETTRVQDPKRESIHPPTSINPQSWVFCPLTPHPCHLEQDTQTCKQTLPNLFRASDCKSCKRNHPHHLSSGPESNEFQNLPQSCRSSWERTRDESLCLESFPSSTSRGTSVELIPGINIIMIVITSLHPCRNHHNYDVH